MNSAESNFKNKLVAKHLKKSYKKRTVVKDVSISIEEGQIIGLLGPNGAGKTTSFYMLVGLIKNDEGHIFFNDTEITKAPIHTRAKYGIAYLPQEPSIFRKLSVEDNIMAILELNTHLSKKERPARLESLLNEFNIEALRKIKGMSLSGGERRRVEIARTLAMDPKFILLDEPFAGVDPISVLDLKLSIRHLQSKKIGILITDHNVRETLDVCERAYIVNEGTILSEGSPKEILNNRKVRDVYLGEHFNL